MKFEITSENSQVCQSVSFKSVCIRSRDRGYGMNENKRQTLRKPT